MGLPFMRGGTGSGYLIDDEAGLGDILIAVEKGGGLAGDGTLSFGMKERKLFGEIGLRRGNHRALSLPLQSRSWGESCRSSQI